MKKVWIVLFLIYNLQAKSFELFLQEALQKSPYLQARALSVEMAAEEAVKIQRYKNPTLALEFSEFSAADAESAKGYKVALTQPLRLWGVSQDRAVLAETLQHKSNAYYTLKQAEFIRLLSLLYVDYREALFLEELAAEELRVTKKIESIVKERYASGSSAKVKHLLAKLDTKQAANNYTQQSLQRLSAYYRLLALSGLGTEVQIESGHTFELIQKDTFADSAGVVYQKALRENALADAKLQANKIEWMDLYLEYEKEPDQKISRVGIAIPLALFNQKNEERNLAVLQAKQRDLDIKNVQRELSLKRKRIQKELHKLKELAQKRAELYDAQKEMLLLYEDAYKIAKVKLIELQGIKTQMIKTKEQLIGLEAQIDRNIIEYNYNAGAYNEK